MKARLILLFLGTALVVSSSCGSGSGGGGGGTSSSVATTGATTTTHVKTDGGMGGSDSCTSHGGW